MKQEVDKIHCTCEYLCVWHGALRQSPVRRRRTEAPVPLCPVPIRHHQRAAKPADHCQLCLCVCLCVCISLNCLPSISAIAAAAVGDDDDAAVQWHSVFAWKRHLRRLGVCTLQRRRGNKIITSVLGNYPLIRKTNAQNEVRKS